METMSTQAGSRDAGTAPSGSADPADPAPDVTASWPRTPHFLNAATMGLPARPVTAALHEALTCWSEGDACPARYDEVVNRARRAYARLVGVPTGWVATGSQASVMAGTMAASLPDGAEVLCVEGDFTSIVHPFLMQEHRGVRTRSVPLEQLAESVGPRTHLVSFSLVQSADGAPADADGVVEAARRHGALTLCDTTQAAGWLPLDAGVFDLTVCSAYKWLCQPRGAAYLTVRPEVLDRLVPVNAGWYAGADVWASTYGDTPALADCARRLDVSPAWLCWEGAAVAVELTASLSMPRVRAHGSGLADALRAGLDLPPAGSPILALPDPDGTLAAALDAAGLVVASRAGGVRIALHLWNDEESVERALQALRPLRPVPAPA